MGWSEWRFRRRIFGPDHEEVAVTLTNLALLLERQGRYPEAEKALETSVRIFQTRLGPTHPQLGVALNNLAALHNLLGQHQDAESAYRRVETIFSEAYGEKHPDTAGVRGNLGNLFMGQGRFAEAEPYFQSALEILQDVAGRHPLTANALNNLGELYRSQARYEEAERLFQQSLAMYEETLGTESVRSSEPRNNLAAMYLEQGRFAEAEAAFSQLARLVESNLGGNSPDLAIVLNNLGNVYLDQGRMVEAETALRRALAIWISHHGKEHANPAHGFHNLGRLYFETGRFDEAESMMDRALQVKLAVLEKDHPDIAATFDLRGDLHLDRGNVAAAVEDFGASLDLSQRALGSGHPQTAVASGKLGRALLKSGRLEEARSRLERSIEGLAETKSFPESLIRNYTALARLEMAEGRPETAIILLASALEEAERLRPTLGGGEETRSVFWERLAHEFDLMVDWQIEAGNPGAAFEYAERSRARALLDQLSLSGVDLRRSLPPEVAEKLTQRESESRADLAELQQRVRFTAARRDLDAAQRREQIRELNERLRLADREYQRIYEEIKSNSPLWNSLLTSGGETAGLKTVQRELVGDRRGLLLYQIGQERSYLFLVSPGDSGLQTFPLRLGSEAEKASIQAGPLTSSKLSRLLAGATTDAMGSISHLAQLPHLSKVLAEALVPADAWARVREYEEVVLIPDGVLHFLPFEMLVMRTAEGEDDLVYWLDEGPAIRYASSATTLLNLDRRGRSRQNGVLSVSNPRFNASFDSEINQGQDTSVDRAMMAFVLDDLPGSARETEYVLKAFPTARVLQGEAATESKLRRELPDRAYLHLATHGLVDERRRSLFSALALTPPPEVAESDNDGLLQLYEIYDLDLTGVELAVLSACQTNVGPRVNGDGVFALSRGFVAAGARRVIASQWRVDDESAAELIGSFFRKLAAASRVAEKPVDYALLLREAKRELRRQDRWSNPRFWAPFILIGAR